MKNLNKAFILVFALVLCLCSGCSSKPENANGKQIHTSDVFVSASDGSVNHVNICFDIENYGTFTVETYPEYAPETVSHFIKLVQSGYYNGSIFEKIIPGHSMISSSDTVLSSGECRETVTGEFFKNGISNELPLTRGTLAMCYLPGEYNSATASFMMILEDGLNLDGEYAGFAKVIDGIPVFDKVTSARITTEGTPVSPIVMKKVYIKE